MRKKGTNHTMSASLSLAVLLSVAAGALTAAGLATGIPVLHVLALCALVFGVFLQLADRVRSAGSQKEAGERLARLEERNERSAALIEELLPVAELLAREDAAIVAAASARRSPIGLPPAEGIPEERLRSFLDGFREPDDGSVERVRGLGSLSEAGQRLGEIDLRLPFIDAILKRVVDHTEKAAMVLLERFGGISEQTERSDADAKHAIEALGSRDKEGTGFEALIKKTHESVIGRTTVINELLNLNRDNAERVKKISDLVAKSEELITGIEDITERSKLIAFNMAVESARIGEKGLGFKVIVHELQRLNDQTTKFARDIMDIVKSFRVSSQEMLDQWLVKSEKLTEQVRTDSSNAEAAVTDLNRSYEVTSALFRSLSECAISINVSMSDILESLQFQDITRQQIEGAASFLSEIHRLVVELGKLLETLGFAKGEPVSMLKSIRAGHEKQLKVSKDHDLFEIMERRFQ